jgi:hypothetical protein
MKFNIDHRYKYSVVAKEYFDKTYGNSYFSARIFNGAGVCIATVPYQYGHSDTWLAVARDVISKWYSNPDDVINCRFSKLFLDYYKTDNCRQRDVKNFVFDI